ncbi:magnesium/cobalt efflux protein, partial [Mesorhizobium sp. M2D.F.Ca.ET.160.01.1.1]
MNDKPETAARPDAGSATKPSEKSEEGSSPSILTGSVAVEPSHAGPSLFDRVLGLFRHRNG